MLKNTMFQLLTLAFSVASSLSRTVSRLPNLSRLLILMGLTVTPSVVDLRAGFTNRTSAPALLVCSQACGRSRL